MSLLKKCKNFIRSPFDSYKASIGAIWSLNITQFCSALNDNLYKFFMIFLLISTLGQAEANNILSAAGTIFVLPYLFFSSSAGILADRISKQKMLVVMKVAEMTIMILALFAFYYKSVWGSYTLLFFLSTHSAIFGPSKYGIISELVSKESVTKANGIITSFTYLAIILGTFLASFITELINKNFVIAASFCLLVAIVGLLISLKIPKTFPQGSEKKFNLLFIKEIYQTLTFCAKTDRLLITLIAAAYFLFVGAFTQLNIIPFAIQSLGMSEVAGGYLFLSTAIGIALGAVLSGKISKDHPNLGISCIACFGMSLLFLNLLIFNHAVILVVLSLILLGMCGGFFIVPLESFIQITSPNKQRGQVIAAENFLSFTGVLLAAFALFIFSEILNLSAAAGFAIIGVLSFFVFLCLFVRLTDQILPFFTKKLISPFYKITAIPEHVNTFSPSTILIIEHGSLKKILLLSCLFPKLRIYFIHNPLRNWSWLNKIFYSVQFVPATDELQNLPERIPDSMIACVVTKNTISLNPKAKKFSLTKFFKKQEHRIFYVSFVSSEIKTGLFSKKEVSLVFSNESQEE